MILTCLWFQHLGVSLCPCQLKHFMWIYVYLLSAKDRRFHETQPSRMDLGGSVSNCGLLRWLVTTLCLEMKARKLRSLVVGDLHSPLIEKTKARTSLATYSSSNCYWRHCGWWENARPRLNPRQGLGSEGPPYDLSQIWNNKILRSLLLWTLDRKPYALKFETQNEGNPAMSVSVKIRIALKAWTVT